MKPPLFFCVGIDFYGGFANGVSYFPKKEYGKRGLLTAISMDVLSGSASLLCDTTAASFFLLIVEKLCGCSPGGHGLWFPHFFCHRNTALHTYVCKVLPPLPGFLLGPTSKTLYQLCTGMDAFDTHPSISGAMFTIRGSSFSSNL